MLAPASPALASSTMVLAPATRVALGLMVPQVVQAPVGGKLRVVAVPPLTDSFSGRWLVLPLAYRICKA